MKTSEIVRALEAHGLLELAQDIATRHHVTIEELLGRSRYRPETLARRELWSRAYSFVPSLPRLGKLFNRDHTSIMAAIQKYTAWQRCAPSCPVKGLAPVFPSEGTCRCNDNPAPQEPACSVSTAAVLSGVVNASVQS